MLSPDTPRNCRISKELYQDMRACLDALTSLAIQFLPKASDRVSIQLARICDGENPIQLRGVNRELQLAAQLIDAVDLLSTILNGSVISNYAERKTGEQNIGECVISLRSLLRNSELCSIGSRVENAKGETVNHSLGNLITKHSKELEDLAQDTPYTTVELPGMPQMRRVFFT